VHRVATPVQMLDGVAQPVPTGRLSQPEEGKVLVPLGRALGRLTAAGGADPRAFTVPRAYLPVRGHWALRVSARRGADRYSGTLALPVR
jgi:hypothetical protein